MSGTKRDIKTKFRTHLIYSQIYSLKITS